MGKFRFVFLLSVAAFLAASTGTRPTQAAVQSWRYQDLVQALKKSEARPRGVHLMGPVQAPLIGEIQSLTLDPGCATTDDWCGGTMVAGDVTYTLPRNLLIDFPAERMSLKQAFNRAPPGCLALGQSGLARNDTCRITTKGAYATLNANSDSCGKSIVGDLFVANGPEFIAGRVTFINYTDAYLRVNGTTGTDTGGTMIRFNDPSGTHSIQQGLGCLAGSQNCSPDVRFTNDPVNYTVAYKNGYPACLPSTVIAAGHATPSNGAGVGDPLCPDTNRTAAVAPDFFVQDSRRYAPVKLGDSIIAEGGFVTVGTATFLSAHTFQVSLGLATRETADQPDYMNLGRSIWHVAPLPEPRITAIFSGLTTLPDSQLDLFALRVGPDDNKSHPNPLTSTVGNPRTTGHLLAGPGGKFQVQLVIPLLKGAPVSRSTSPCFHLANAGFDACPAGGTLAEEFSILAPPSREVQAVTRRRIPLATGVFTLDMRGRQASNGQWTQPLGASLGGLILAEPGEGNLGQGFGPLVMETLPWTLDRRTSPSGCLATGCETTAQPLIPYPSSRVNPIDAVIAQNVPPEAASRVLTYFTFAGGQLVPHVFGPLPADSCPLPVTTRFASRFASRFGGYRQ